MALVAGSLDGGMGRLSSVSLTLGKVYSRAFLAANRIIAYINKIAIRLLAKDGPLTLDRLYALYDTAISCYSGVDLYCRLKTSLLTTSFTRIRLVSIGLHLNNNLQPCHIRRTSGLVLKVYL